MHRRNRMVFVFIVGTLYLVSGLVSIVAGGSTALAGWPLVVVGTILIALQLAERTRAS